MADTDSRSGTTYGTKAILGWCAEVHHPLDGGLAQAFGSPALEGMPEIQVGRAEGRVLNLILKLHQSRKVVEVGTLAGFSAAEMARALPPKGHLWTIEYEPRHAEVARRNLEAAGVADQVSVLVGKGVDILPILSAEGPFDAVFLDADKESYAAYGAWAAKNLRKGGLLIADNVYLFGDLLDEGPRAEAMRRFHLEAAKAFDSVVIPTPDGLFLGIKR